jgi:predicted transposase/invertase (TIGR01784 family)
MTDINKKSHTPHDDFFKNSLSNIDISRDFLRHELPAEILKITDFETLSFVKNDFIDIDIGKKAADVLFSAKMIGDADGYIYLLSEHQSTSDYWMCYRLMRYVFCIHDYHRKLYPEDKYLPIVYPLVVYNGKIKFTFSLDFFEYFKHPHLVRQLFNSPFQLVNVSQMSDEKILNSHLFRHEYV